MSCLGVESRDKSRLYEEGPPVSKDFLEDFAVKQDDDSVQNVTMKKADTMETLVEDVEEQQEPIEDELERKEARRRHYSPRMTLPVQKKEEKEKKPDEAVGVKRRVSPKFRGEARKKVSQKAEEEKMYLFDLA